MWQKFYILSMMFLFFFVPFVILVILYTTIGRRLFFQDNHIVSSKNDRLSYANLRARKQVVLMLAAVVILFFICLLPMITLRIWSLFGSKVNLGFEGYLNLLYFCRLMLYLNSALNPVCYSLLSTKFRGSFRRVLIDCPPANRHERGESLNTSRGNTSPVFYRDKRRCRHLNSVSSSKTSSVEQSCTRCSIEDRSKFWMIKFEKKGTVPLVSNTILEQRQKNFDEHDKCIENDNKDSTWT